jgi:hypothetical protein
MFPEIGCSGHDSVRHLSFWSGPPARDSSAEQKKKILLILRS